MMLQLWREMAVTSGAIHEACADLKLLGKKDFRMLLQWRLKAAEAWRRAQNAQKAAEGGGSDDEDDESEEGEEAAEARIDGELTELERMAAQRKKSYGRTGLDPGPTSGFHAAAATAVAAAAAGAAVAGAAGAIAQRW